MFLNVLYAEGFARQPIINDADDLLGEVYDISEDTIEYVKAYNSEYGRES